MDFSENMCLIEGIISVKSVIDGKKRDVFKIYIDLKKRKDRDRKIMGFISYLKEKNIDFEFLPREEIDKIASGKTHGGVIAYAGKRSFESVENLLHGAGYGDYFVFLDGVEDPYNFGYSVRVLYALGCKGIIVPDRDWLNSDVVISRASAGAYDLCDIALAGDDDEVSAKIIKDSGFDIVCSALSEKSVSLFEYVPEKPFVLFIGGEKRGISKEFMDCADSIVCIPYARENVRYSLPTNAVCSVYAGIFEKYTRKDKK